MTAGTSPYELSVFINCPYDPHFEELFHAIVFAVAALGFVPRSALEAEGRAETRISKIIDGISNSKYSIHDLSRFTGEGVENLARFNMPLELGMAIALRHERAGTAKSHNWLVLVPSGSDYQRFVSDLAGFDPHRHELDVLSVIREVSAWLQLQDEVIRPAPPARTILDAFPQFRAELEGLRTAALGRINWPEIVLAARRTAPRL